MNIKPLGNRVVIKLIKQKTTSSLGIITSTEDEIQRTQGEVIAIGTGFGEENVQNLGLKTGDTVMFGRYSGEEVPDESDSNTIYKIISSKDIVAIIEK